MKQKGAINRLTTVPDIKISIKISSGSGGIASVAEQRPL